MEIGTIVLAKFFNGLANLSDTEKYQQLLTQNFSNIGMLAFGQMPFIAKGPNPEVDYDWKNIDYLVDWAVKNNINVCYNVVINSHKESFPDWYYLLSKEEKLLALERHVKAVIERYKNKINLYKLVNEASPYPEENFLETGIDKSNLIVKIFEWAKEVYPEGLFMLNDHFPFIIGDEKFIKFIDMITNLLKKGAPIGVIGIEGHLGYRPIPFQIPKDAEFNDVIDKIHEITNLPIHITEFDLSFNNAPKNPYPGSEIDPNKIFIANGIEYSNWFEYQAYAYQHFYELCSSKDYIKALYFWGFTDKDMYSWERPGVGFFDQDNKLKPVYNAMKETLLKEKNAQTS